MAIVLTTVKNELKYSDKYCNLIGRKVVRTECPQRQERKLLNSFPLLVRLGVQIIQYVHECIKAPTNCFNYDSILKLNGLS